MATLILSAAGAALGAGFGGTVLGLSGAVIGRAIGATLGRALDQRLLGGGSEPVEVGRIDRLRLMGASEGAAIARVWGRVRIGGQVIWASQFQEHVSRRRGGKGGGPTMREYSYSVSLAIGLCEGEILGIGRIWVDGSEIPRTDLTLRVYNGSADQLPDPKILAVEGSDTVPAYRGLAYVVIEDLDITPYGNRVPQFTFEVMRNAQRAGVTADEAPLSELVTAVAMIPGTGEYALATSPVSNSRFLGESVTVNAHTASGKTDFETSLDQMLTELPNCKSISLVVSWFGSDLRCGACEIRPLVEQAELDGVRMPWRSGGIDRAEAGILPCIDGSSYYGGTPSDASVVEAIKAMRERGLEVMFYPFILMDQMPENTLPDPWTGATGQPVMPWRGRITASLAPGRVNSPDRTSALRAEVASFFGMAERADFSLNANVINYSGPEDWGFRRFILHYANLCHLAGGVDAFCIGSELRGLTQLRDEADSFVAVEYLTALAADVRAILGPETKLTYAADWTEYGSYSVDGNLYFPLDSLWASDEIDFVGIDNYLPLADWRDGVDHADRSWGSPYALEYLESNVEAGEYYDWYYDGPEGEKAQNRLPIADGAHDEPWVYRLKDLRNWWANSHHPRIGGERLAIPTDWSAGSKPIRFTEFGCAAVDKGANQPNRFLDRLSSESLLPRASTGRRDDLMQMQYLRAMSRYWRDPRRNPLASHYDGCMIEAERMHLWSWDARPFPAFPGRVDLWSDGPNYARGHWLNGRAVNQPLSAVIREICAGAGVYDIDTSRALGVVRGFAVENVQTARASLQPLLLTYGVDVFDRDGALHFVSRGTGVDHLLDAAAFVFEERLDGRAETTRAPAQELAGRLRMRHIEAEGDYEIRLAEVVAPDETRDIVAESEASLVLTRGEARATAARWLAETRVGRDSLRLVLPPSHRDLGAGDVVALADGSRYRLDRMEYAGALSVEATRIEEAIYANVDWREDVTPLAPYIAPAPTFPVLLDLPLLTGAEVPHHPYVAVAAHPWPGAVALWSGGAEDGFHLNRLITAPSVIGRTESNLAAAKAGVWDRGAPLRLRLGGASSLQSVSVVSVLNGANAMAIGDVQTGVWEVFQFVEAQLVAPQTYEISMRLRGQAGSDAIMPKEWPSGSLCILLDAAPKQFDLPFNALGLARDYRIGLGARGYDDPNVVSIRAAFDGAGLRPYRVAHLRQHGGLAEKVAFTWIRRGRLGADNWQQYEIPLGEEGESYLARLQRGDQVLLEVVLAEPRFELSVSLQADLGLDEECRFAVAQISAQYGPGPFQYLTIG